MLALRFKKELILILSIFLAVNCFSQNKQGLTDGREGSFCTITKKIIDELPKEVLFGIQINANGDVYFSMSDRKSFDKIFRNNSYGVTADIVSKSRYNCSSNSTPKEGIPRGTFLPVTYRDNLVAEEIELSSNGIFTKIGELPKEFIGKEIEGNLVIVNGPNICYYTNFLDIDRSAWELLPMGFYTDSLLSEYKRGSTSEKDYFTYSSKVSIEIPFAKAGSSFDFTFLQTYFDSLNISSSIIKKVEVRAYSSVEGSEITNKQLMQSRANSVVSALKKYQPSITRINTVTAENWLDFFRDTREAHFEDFEGATKFEIKKLLTNRTTIDKLEPILAKHRKAVAILYLENKTPYVDATDSLLLKDFDSAILSKQISKAQGVMKEISERIADNRLPIEFLERLNIPKSKDYSPLLNDREIFKYLLKATGEYEAFENLMAIRKLDPENGKLNYNICVLRFFLWQFGNDDSSKNIIVKEIKSLSKQGIPDILTKRMMINNFILRSEDQMGVSNYKGKDSSISEIRNIYNNIKATDAEILSLAKYYSFYSHQEWAEEIIVPKVTNIDVEEDLAFYYLNLLLFQPGRYDSEEFIDASVNAINLNAKRFCNFFKPIGKGGAGMQLLESEELRALYCEECN